MRAQMLGVSWRRGCPVAIKDLRVIRLRHLDAVGRTRIGELVVHRTVVPDVISAFGTLYDARVRIASMRRIEFYSGSDFASIEANNTSAFNCRRVSGLPGGQWSMHAYGMAVDINPIQNPFVTRTGRVAHRASWPFRVRTRQISSLQIMSGDSTTRAFAAVGWEWGGDWAPPRDYQHFAPPRSTFTSR